MKIKTFFTGAPPERALEERETIETYQKKQGPKEKIQKAGHRRRLPIGHFRGSE